MGSDSWGSTSTFLADKQASLYLVEERLCSILARRSLDHLLLPYLEICNIYKVSYSETVLQLGIYIVSPPSPRLGNPEVIGSDPWLIGLMRDFVGSAQETVSLYCTAECSSLSSRCQTHSPGILLGLSCVHTIVEPALELWERFLDLIACFCKAHGPNRHEGQIVLLSAQPIWAEGRSISPDRKGDRLYHVSRVVLALPTVESALYSNLSC